MTFTNFILSRFVSPLMCSEAMPLENLSELIDDICRDEVQAHFQKRLILKETEGKIESWLKGAKNESEKEVIDLLWEKPAELKRKLGLYAVLANYPEEVGERAAGRIFHSIRKLGISPESVDLDDVDANKAANGIEIYLNSEFRNGISQSDALKIVEWASGLIPSEFRILARTFERFPDALTNTILTALRKKFSPVLN